MALKLVRKKKAKTAAGAKKKGAVDKFVDAVDVQLRLAKGEKVRKGRGLAKSWMEDGSAYAVDKVLVPRVGNKVLHPKSAYVVDMKQKQPPTNELEELKATALSGKLNNRINALVRKQRKKSVGT